MLRSILAISFALLAVSALPAVADPPGETPAINLNGAWRFALDPLHRGEADGWHRPPADWDHQKPLKVAGWDDVAVPHCWSLDPRYFDITRVWYRRTFAAPQDLTGRVARLQFESVFHTCRVWINGQLVGTHAGGYLPFERDVTEQLKPGALNLIAVEVDNSWGMHTLPGARPGVLPRQQLYPWWNYGGILGDARVTVSPTAYVANQKIAVKLNANGDAEVQLQAHVRNAAVDPQSVRLRGTILDDAGSTIVAQATEEPVDLEAGAERVIRWTATIPADQVRRWGVDHPHLYTSVVTIDGDAAPAAHRATFGIRTIDIRDGQLLLNGEPIRLAGANRVLDHPATGGIDTPERIAEDMRLMKQAHLEFSRLQHYPCRETLLDWADRNGFLIVAEAASWGFPEEHLPDPVVRDQFRRQMQAMIEAQWNHPCIIGWSIGNEYVSWAPEGVDWTRDMKAFVRQLDDTRPVVFVGLGGVMKQDHLPREQRSLHYSDFLCINCYMGEPDIARLLDAVHAVWPDKPIFITEYGKRSDRVADESERVRHFHNVLDIVRARPYICGLSYWTFNDYRSRYPGTNPNGYRPWGMVDPLRQPRGLYHAMQAALSPAKLEAQRGAGGIRVQVVSRADFPTLALEGYTLRLINAAGASLAEAPVPRLEPGAQVTVPLPLPADVGDAPLTVQLWRPTGFLSTQTSVTHD